MRLWAMEVSVPHPVEEERVVTVGTHEPPKFSEWCIKEAKRWHKFNTLGDDTHIAAPDEA
jgi:hypothetical protein